MKKNQSAASCQKLSIVDESPALNFDNHGNVKTDMTCKARSEGLAVGSAYCIVKNFQGIKKHRIGTVTSIGKTDLTVTFCADADANVDEAIMSCPLNVLKAHEPAQPVKNARKADAAVEESSGLQPEVKGIEWKAYDDDVIAQAVKHNLTAFSEHIRIQQSPTHSDVSILDDRHIMVARKELHPLSLIIIPRASGLRLAATDANEDITVDFAGARETVK